MILNNFRFLTDENISPKVILFLKEQGFDVKDTFDTNMISAKDIEWLALAEKEQRVIITQDSDFSQLVFTQPINFIDIIFLRPGSFFSAFHIATLEAIFLENIEVEAPFILTARNKGDNIQIKIRLI